MRLIIVGLIALITLGTAQSAERTPHPLFTPMSGYHVESHEEQEFALKEFHIGPDKTQAVEGRLIRVGYLRDSGLSAQTGYAVAANHRNALKSLGGEVVYVVGSASNPSYTIFRVQRGGETIWGEIDTTAGGNDFVITTVTVGQMKQEVTAKSLETGLARDGRVALYGILFDSGKASIRDESEPEIKAIAEMLKSQADRKVYVVGHTDNVGSLAANLTLSQQRAEAVVTALTTRYGIAAGRLAARGVAQLSPVASNESEQGRQSNRRVEVVAQ